MPERSGCCTRCDRSAWRWPGVILSILIKIERDYVSGVALAESSGVGDAAGDVDVGDGAEVGEGVGVGEPPEIFVSSSSRRRFSSAKIGPCFATWIYSLARSVWFTSSSKTAV